MNIGGRNIVIGLLAMAVGAGGAVLAMGASAPVNINDRAAVETIVREYILSHPEILPEAMRNLESRETGKAIETNRRAIETPYGHAWEGAADADVTLVEFFDYACGYCRASRPVITQLLAEDKKLRIVYREIPILGASSTAAARTSLAVAKLGDYATFHHALFDAGRPTPSVIADALSRARVDADAVRSALSGSEVDAEIANNMELQRALELTGTPSWVVGDRLLQGAVGYDQLKAAIAEARAAKK